MSSSSRQLKCLALVCLAALSSSGCHAFRLEGGLGIGLGADLQVSGLVRGGALAYFRLGGGLAYGYEASDTAYGFTLGPLFFRRGQSFKSKPHRWEKGVGVFHGLTHRWIERNERAHPWAFDLTLALLMVHVRVGFDPLELLGGYPSFPSESLEPPNSVNERGLDQARREAGVSERPIVALVAPEADDEVEQLLETLGRLFPSRIQDPATTLWRSQALWVCVGAEEVGAEPGETLVLLDGDGQRVAGRRVDLSNPELADAALGELLGGTTGIERRAHRLPAARAKELEQILRIGLYEEVEGVFSRPPPGYDESDAQRYVEEHAAWLVLYRRTGEDEAAQVDALVRCLRDTPRPFGVGYRDEAEGRRYLMLSLPQDEE